MKKRDSNRKQGIREKVTSFSYSNRKKKELNISGFYFPRRVQFKCFWSFILLEKIRDWEFFHSSWFFISRVIKSYFEVKYGLLRFMTCFLGVHEWKMGLKLKFFLSKDQSSFLQLHRTRRPSILRKRRCCQIRSPGLANQHTCSFF